jgi:hypothetical protein
MSAAWKLVCERTNTCSHRSNFCALAAPFVGGPHKWRSLRLSRRLSTAAEETQLDLGQPSEAGWRKWNWIEAPLEKRDHDIRQ